MNFDLACLYPSGDNVIMQSQVCSLPYTAYIVVVSLGKLCERVVVVKHSNFLAFSYVIFHFSWKMYLKNRLLKIVKPHQTYRPAYPLYCCHKYYFLAINVTYIITFCMTNIVIFSKTHRRTFCRVNRPKQTLISLLDTDYMFICVQLL